jgi:hypothetical protein
MPKWKATVDFADERERKECEVDGAILYAAAEDALEMFGIGLEEGGAYQITIQAIEPERTGDPRADYSLRLEPGDGRARIATDGELTTR